MIVKKELQISISISKQYPLINVNILKDALESKISRVSSIYWFMECLYG